MNIRRSDSMPHGVDRGGKMNSRGFQPETAITEADVVFTGREFGLLAIRFIGSRGEDAFFRWLSEDASFAETASIDAGNQRIALYKDDGAPNFGGQVVIAPSVWACGDGESVCLPPALDIHGNCSAWDDQDAPIIAAPQWMLDLITTAVSELGPVCEVSQ